MSDLFMDLQHRRRRHWHNHHNQPPTAKLTSATTSTRISSVRQAKPDHTFSHLSTQLDAAAHNGDFNNLNNETNFDQVEENTTNDNEYDDDIFSNILSLKLRKPKHWKWELTTSKSCSNIALPRILLYDHKGQLLVDAKGGDGDDGECVYRQENFERPKRDKSKKRTLHQRHQQQQQQQQRQGDEHKKTPLQDHQKSATTNLTHSIRKALENEFNGLQIQEATPSPEPYSQTSSHSHRSRKAVDFNTTDLPDYSLSRRSSSLRGVRFNVIEDKNDYMQSHTPDILPTPPSTTTTPTSSSSGPREKRKYRRSHSSGRSSANSESILERFSYQKGRFSSPEYTEEQEVYHRPRYFLRTYKASTLVVKEDSFSKHPLRRRRRRTLTEKDRSTESLQKSPNSITPPASLQSGNNSPNPSEMNRQRQKPIRRHYTDGNIFLDKHSLSSDDGGGVLVDIGQKQILNNVNNNTTSHLRKYAEEHNQGKADLNYSPDVHQNGKVR